MSFDPSQTFEVQYWVQSNDDFVYNRPPLTIQDFKIFSLGCKGAMLLEPLSLLLFPVPDFILTQNDCRLDFSSPAYFNRDSRIDLQCERRVKDQNSASISSSTRPLKDGQSESKCTQHCLHADLLCLCRLQRKRTHRIQLVLQSSHLLQKSLRFHLRTMVATSLQPVQIAIYDARPSCICVNVVSLVLISSSCVCPFGVRSNVHKLSG
jgi:hypothetical protein